ncbi:MAG: hypothetical protein ACYC1Z_14185 [Georgenia sp.]
MISVAGGGKGEGLDRGEERQARAAPKLGKTVGIVLQEYVDLGGDDDLVKRLRRVI